jgi:hypothetical protein
MLEIKKPRLEVWRGMVKYCNGFSGIQKYYQVSLQFNCNVEVTQLFLNK